VRSFLTQRRYPLKYLFKVGLVRKVFHFASRAFHSHPVNSGSDKLPYMEEGDLKFSFKNSKEDEFESKFAFRPHFASKEHSADSMELANVVVDPVPTLGTIFSILCLFLKYYF
jgi:hypothetical protein